MYTTISAVPAGLVDPEFDPAVQGVLPKSFFDASSLWTGARAARPRVSWQNFYYSVSQNKFPFGDSRTVKRAEARAPVIPATRPKLPGYYQMFLRDKETSYFEPGDEMENLLWITGIATMLQSAS